MRRQEAPHSRVQSPQQTSVHRPAGPARGWGQCREDTTARAQLSPPREPRHGPRFPTPSIGPHPVITDLFPLAPRSGAPPLPSRAAANQGCASLYRRKVSFSPTMLLSVRSPPTRQAPPLPSCSPVNQSPRAGPSCSPSLPRALAHLCGKSSYMRPTPLRADSRIPNHLAPSPGS